MLKFKDSDGKVIGELTDDASEPIFYEEKKMAIPGTSGSPVVNDDKGTTGQ